MVHAATGWPMSGDEGRRDPGTGSLFADVPDRLEAERFDPLLACESLRIERIVSTGQTTPCGDWYDQPWDEWVVIVAGGAEILLADEDAPRALRPGDYLFLPAHLRHRVTWTDPARPTIWLAVHIGASVGAAAGELGHAPAPATRSAGLRAVGPADPRRGP